MSAPERAEWHTTAPLSAEGPNGLVQPQRILEWMQEAAAHASTLSGYPPERYKAMGAAWFIREVVLAIDGEIRYGEAISVETWVADVRRFRSRRSYRIRRGDAVVARAEVDWALLERDPATGRVRPLRFDEDLIAAFPCVPDRVLAPGDVPEWAQVTGDLRALPTDERKVRPTEIDHNGHVNHVLYLEWLEDHARLALGDDRELAAVRIQYVADAKRGDQIAVSGALDGEIVRQDIVRGDQVIARGVSRRYKVRDTEDLPASGLVAPAST